MEVVADYIYYCQTAINALALHLCNQFRVRKLHGESRGEVRNLLKVEAAVDEVLVADEGRVGGAQEGDLEVLGVGAEGGEDVLVGGGLETQDAAQLVVVVDPVLVEVAQLLAERHGVLPQLALVEQRDDLPVQLLLPLPLLRIWE